MPLNFANLRSRIVRTKAATIADAYEMEFSSGAWGFGATGVAVVAGTANRILITAGGWADQKITSVLSSTTAAGSESLGVYLRFQTNEAGYATYYYARQVLGVFRIQKVVNGTFSSLISGSFTWTASTDHTFTFQAVGSALSASINNGSTSLSLSVTDSALGQYGGFGFRSGPTNSTQIACRNWQVEEV